MSRHPSSSDPARRRGLILGLVALGLVFRVAVAFPAHKYPADADMAINPLCAFKVLRGEAPVFAVAQRVGSLSCHLTAGLFYLFGVSRAVLAVGPTLSCCLLLPLWYLFLREILGPKNALVALVFIALPSPAFTFWTYMPNTYPETVLLCGATLWLASRLARGDRYWLTSFGLGVSAGFGWWNSIQTLQCSGPALIFLLWRRPRLVRDRAFVPFAAAGLLLGAAPWLAYNLYYSLASFRDNMATRTPADLGTLADNGIYVLTQRLPELVASVPYIRGSSVAQWLAVPTLLIVTTSTLFFFAVALTRWLRNRRDTHLEPESGAPLFFGLVALAVVATNVVSEAGAMRGQTVRYVLPFYLLVPGFLAVFVRWIALRSRALAVTLAGVVVLFSLTGTSLPWSPARQIWVRAATWDTEVVTFLAAQDVTVVVGDFWQVYPLNFLSRERIRAMPLEPAYDLYGVAAGLPSTPQRWAFLARWPTTLAPCLERADIDGTTVRVNSFYSVFLPQDNPPADPSPRHFLERVRSLCYRSDLGVDQWLPVGYQQDYDADQHVPVP